MRANTNAAGTGNLIPGSAVNAAYRDFTGCITDELYPYLIEQGSDWESGTARWNGTALVRLGPGNSNDPSFDSSTGSLLSVNAGSIVSITDNDEAFPIGYDMKSALVMAMQSQTATFNGTAESNVAAKIDRGGIVGMALHASTNVSFGAGGNTNSVAQYTVPSGCVVIMLDWYFSESVRTNSGFYGHVLRNVTQNNNACGGAASGNSWGAEEPLFGGGLLFGQGGGFTINFPAVVAVAGDVLKCIAYNPSGDGNKRLNMGGYVFMVCDTATKKPLKIR